MELPHDNGEWTIQGGARGCRHEQAGVAGTLAPAPAPLASPSLTSQISIAAGDDGEPHDDGDASSPCIAAAQRCLLRETHETETSHWETHETLGFVSLFPPGNCLLPALCAVRVVCIGEDGSVPCRGYTNTTSQPAAAAEACRIPQ